MSSFSRLYRWRGGLWFGLIALAACTGTSGGENNGAGGTPGGNGGGGSLGSAGKGGTSTDDGAPGSGGSNSGAGGATGGGSAGRTGTAGTSGGVGGGSADLGGTTGGAGIAGTVNWPNDMSKANSDTWLAQNHDRIAQLQPRVLVIDLENTANATTLGNAHIAALKEASSPHKFKDATAQPALAYQLVKIAQAPKGTAATISYTSWNTQAFADSNLQIKDPADPTGPNLTLCGLFEKGVINEVWCMASANPKCGETQEAKQMYDANGDSLGGPVKPKRR